MPREKKWKGFLLPGVAVLTLVIDQISKRVVMTSLRPGESWNPVAALERWVSLTYVTNTGAAFGLFPDHAILFMIIAVVVAVIVFYYRHLPGDQWLLQTSLGLQLGGALGNLLDRLRYDGRVIDFIDFKIWPVFNLADTAIVVAVTILAWHLWRDESLSAKGSEVPSKFNRSYE